MTTQPGCFPAQVTAFPGPYQAPPELPLGRWHLMANGRIMLFDILSVHGSDVQANLSSGSVGYAKWDRPSGKLVFTRITSITQQYSGYLMQYDPDETHWRLAGGFGNVEVGEEAGWYGTLAK